jgi:hypothetical protein
MIPDIRPTTFTSASWSTSHWDRRRDGDTYQQALSGTAAVWPVTENLWKRHIKPLSVVAAPHGASSASFRRFVHA